ncbi:MAG: integrin alpha [Pseudomonadota bacterium]
MEGTLGLERAVRRATRARRYLAPTLPLGLALCCTSAMALDPLPVEAPLTALRPDFGGDGSNGVVYDGDRDPEFPSDDGYDAIGVSVTNIGDFNGDGLDDIYIGDSTNVGNYGAPAGRGFLIFGRTGGFDPLVRLPDDVGNGVLLRTRQRINYAGESQRVGDVNGDGFADVLIGARNFIGAGSAYLLFGQSNPRPVITLDDVAENPGTGARFIGVNDGDSTGQDVAGACDLNGDGLDDMLIGASGADPDGRNAAGVVYVVYGSSDFPPAVNLASLLPQAGGDGSAGFVVKGAAPANFAGDIGDEIACADINADGLPDLLLTPFVLYGRNTAFPPVIDLANLLPENGGNGRAGFVVTVERPQGVSRVQGAGDMNGDGRSDMVVDLAPIGIDGIGAREAVVLYGSSAPRPARVRLDRLRPALGGDGTDGFFLRAEVSNPQGFVRDRVASAGDFDGDGIDDLLIGHPDIDANGVQRDGVVAEGVTYLLYGRSGGFPAQVDLTDLRVANGGDGTEGIVFRGESLTLTENPGRMGEAVSSAGDLNGDGYDDVLLGAPHSPRFLNPAGGGAYVVFGRPRPVPAP